MKCVINPRDHYSEVVNRCQGYNGKWGVSAVSGKIRGDPEQRRDRKAFQEKIRELKKVNAH